MFKIIILAMKQVFGLVGWQQYVTKMLVMLSFLLLFFFV